MSKPLTTQHFLDRALPVHGETYDYTDTVFIVRNDKLTMSWPTYGPSAQPPRDRLRMFKPLVGITEQDDNNYQSGDAKDFGVGRET